ncbi:uncharacterized protein [Procambarus clarkii]|uniref:uncharacterized protein n=1 Tax=Procambarus clarkii TaxID=6728 RepID=UPI003744ABC6
MTQVTGLTSMALVCVNCLLVLLNFTGLVNGVRIKEVSVPSVAVEGDEIHLRCDYQDEEGSSLYTLKWYKDAQEFYRHQPGISPHTADDRCVDDHMYDVVGVTVDCWVSTEREVVLKSVTRSTSGEYQCEVIGEHPNFRKETLKASLKVYSEPLQKPLLAGMEESYTPMEFITLNCTAMNTEYIPAISWVINGRPAHADNVRQVENRTVGLFFQARDDLFQRGVITVSCFTSLGTKHVKSTQIQLPNRDYLSAQEYYYNAGKKKTYLTSPVLTLLLLNWVFAFLLSWL